MYFEYQQEGIARLLGKNRNELVIPRYQRDYSWNTTQAKTLLDDIANCIHIENGKLKPSQYFFGNILLKGKPVDSDQTLEIIDGQQRITTVYILLAAIYGILEDLDDKSSAKENLRVLVYENSLLYKSSEFEERKTLYIESSHNFFPYYLFPEKKEDRKDLDILNNSDQSIKNVFDYFDINLQEEKLNNLLKTSDKDFSYIELLTVVYYQLENLTVTIVSSTDGKEANSIFESLNSKGVPLEQSDLIKNKIFTELNTNEPTDNAQKSWTKIKKNLEKSKVGKLEFPWINLDDFINIYWRANYANTTNSRIYYIFKQKVSDGQINPKDFIKDLELYSKEFKALYGDRTHFSISDENWDEINNYMELLVQSLQIKQTYPMILQIVHAFNLKLISEKTVKNNLKFMSNFHIIYNEMFKLPGNRLQYDKYARLIRTKINTSQYNDDTKKTITDILSEMRKELSDKLPKKEEFDSIVKTIIQDMTLTYTNKVNNPNNKKTKNIFFNYTILKNKKISKDDNIEHMVQDSNDDKTSWSIGNLIYLNKTINSKLKDKDLSEKITIYKSIKGNKDIEELLKTNYFNSILEHEKELAFQNRQEEILKAIYTSVNNNKTNPQGQSV